MDVGIAQARHDRPATDIIASSIRRDGCRGTHGLVAQDALARKQQPLPGQPFAGDDIKHGRIIQDNRDFVHQIPPNKSGNWADLTGVHAIRLQSGVCSDFVLASSAILL
jgi:hypothetical protein